MKLITHERIPCWYELSWNEGLRILIVRIHEDFLKKLKKIPKSSPIVESFIKNFGFKKFEGDPKKNFGFQGVLYNKGISDGFMEYSIIVPEVKVKIDKACHYCQGSGKRDMFPEDPCIACEGDGKEREYRYAPVRAISASLTILFMILRDEAETGDDVPQLLTVETMCAGDMHGGSMHGAYSIDFVRWLSGFKEHQTIPEMEQAMMFAYERMMTLRHESRCSFRAFINDTKGWLNISIPGDACGLHPSSGMGCRDGRGYEFSCHNVDNSVQQLTLLCGLAALHDLARHQLVGQVA